MASCFRTRNTLAGGLTLGLLCSLWVPGCIFPDQCILVRTWGADWCSTVEGARMWPIGQPELAEPLLDENLSPPNGCACLNDGEVQILADEAPAEQAVIVREKVQQAARFECATLVPPGYDHNCFIVDDGDPLAPSPTVPVYEAESFECYGSCSYIAQPKVGCGPDPNPWECNGVDGGTEDTGGTDTGAGTPDTTPVVEGRVTP